jgi:hypothetical protein
MGPNCYICPGKYHAIRCDELPFSPNAIADDCAGGGFTQVHQDGHGTVDSGHSCIAGLDEVVMLRRLPEDHKRNACRMVPTFKECRKDDKAQNMLYRLPHDDGREDKPTWPTDAIIESWQGMG